MRKLQPVVEWALLLAAVAYTLAFMALQTGRLLSPWLSEWDARCLILPTLRYHGSGLFPDDLTVDFMSVYGPVLYKAIFWVGTLFAEPFTIARLLPFALLAVAAWQALQLGRHFGGLALGAILMAIVVHQPAVWDRLTGANPRAFAFPLIIAFVRYAATQRQRGALVTLLLQALSYPSAFIVCAPAYGLLVLWGPERQRNLVRFGLTAALSLSVIVLAMFTVNPQVGKPITMAQMAGLKQRAVLRMYPLPPPAQVLDSTFHSIFVAAGRPLLPALAKLQTRATGTGCWALVLVLLVLARKRLRRFPPVFWALLAAAGMAFAIAYPLAYRLYLPDRLLFFPFPSAVLLGWPLLAYLAFEETLKRWAGVAAAGLGFVVHFGIWGDGLKPNLNLWDWRREVTPAIEFTGTLPKDVRIAGPLWTSSFIQTFGRRQTLFSATTNVQAYYPYAAEIEHRIEDWYNAYYATDLATVQSFCRQHRVTHLYVDTADFAGQAYQRAFFYEPWTSLARTLLRTHASAGFALAHPPARAILFRSGTQLILDAKQL